ncbi:hypothetical protein ACBJ59_10765 [Nonomuraea sp. MTCD27]|uniref:hypothetical protein n=1 Tax=Nonomuraea sp. MTCD27 TaxID=1676747 RepID=UPI0035C26226
MSHLPPFSGDDPTCPKCGNVGASSTFSERNPRNGLWGDRLVRVCLRCGYSWDESTVDQDQEDGQGVGA